MLEYHIEDDEDLYIREYAIIVLSNLAAEECGSTIKAVLQKGKLFHILKENIEMNNLTEDILESIVNLISNLSRNESYFIYPDFEDVHGLIQVLFPLVMHRNIVNTTLMSSFKKIISQADDDEIYKIVNCHYHLVS